MEMDYSTEKTYLTDAEENNEEVTQNYDAIFGENNQPNKKYSQPTVLGELRNPRRFSWIEWLFLVLCLVAFIGTLGITIERLVDFKKQFNFSSSALNGTPELVECNKWTCTSDFTYAILLIANLIFILLYAVDGVLRERGFEILALPVAITVVVIYIVGNYIAKGSEQDNPLRIARLALTIVFGPPLAVLAVLIYVKNGRLQFNLVGSNTMLMRIYRIRSFMNVLLLFNLHLATNLVILAMVRDETFISETEMVVVVVFVVYMVLIAIIGWFGLNYELIWMTVVFGIVYSPSVAYYIYKIINVSTNIKDYWDIEGNYNGENEKYRFIGSTLLTVCILGLILYVLTLIFTVLSANGYSKGLSEKVDPPFKPLLMKIRLRRKKDHFEGSTYSGST